MAEWKKVIVSGSDAELNEVNTSSHITASGIISASGKLYGNLNENEDQIYVVVYNTSTGELEYKELNLINAKRAPELYLISHDNDDDNIQNFRFSFDSSSNTGNPIQAPIVLSASIDGITYDHAISTNDATFPEISINDQWNPTEINNVAYFNPDVPTNNTASQAEGHASGPGNGRYGVLSPGVGITDITLHLQVADNEDSTATPSVTGAPYQAKGFDSPAPDDDGEIRVYVNTMEIDSPTATIDVGPTIGAITTTSSPSNVTCNISVSSSNDDNGETDFNKCNRTGTVTVKAAAQNDGYNYAFLFYTGSRGSNQVRAITNFTEWFYDVNGSTQGIVGTNAYNLQPAEFTNEVTHSISGVKYVSPPTVGIFKSKTSGTNQYRNIYPVNTGITISNINTTLFSTLGVTQSGNYLETNPTLTDLDASQASQQIGLAPLDTNPSAHTQSTITTASGQFTFNSLSNFLHQPEDYLFDDSGYAPFDDYTSQTDAELRIDTQYTHINKPSSGIIIVEENRYLINGLNSGSDTAGTRESFRGEKYRLRDRTYTLNQRGTDYLFNSTHSLASSTENGNNGLLQFGSYLVYPTKAGDAGNFHISDSPASFTNVNYSSLTGERTYYRYFSVPASPNGAGNVAFQIEFKGSGRIVPDGSSLYATDTQYFNVFVQRLGDGSTTIVDSDMTSGIVDALGDVYDLSPLNTSTHYIPLNNSITNAVNYTQTNHSGVSGQPGHLRSAIPIADSLATGLLEDEHILVKIKVPQGWTGYIDAIGIRYGNYNGGSTPVLNGMTYK